MQAREEAEMVIFESVAEVLAKTNLRASQASRPEASFDRAVQRLP